MARNRLPRELAAGLSGLLGLPVKQLMGMPDDKLKVLLSRLASGTVPKALLASLAAVFGSGACQRHLLHHQKLGPVERNKEAMTQERDSLKEERLEEEQLRKIVPLKNGGQIEAGLGISCVQALRILLEEEPQQFHALVAVSTGKSDETDPKSIECLRDAGYLGGAIEKEYRDVLLSAYLETVEGPVLVNPFNLTDGNEAKDLERAVEERQDRFTRRLREKMKEQENDGPAL